MKGDFEIKQFRDLLPFTDSCRDFTRSYAALQKTGAEHIRGCFIPS